MSYLREIMQKLSESRPNNPGKAGKLRIDAEELLKLHVDAYLAQLENCTKAMLQYEWAWWKEHIATLRLCLTKPEMQVQIGGQDQIKRLIEESIECQKTLEDTMKKRMVNPSGQTHQINPTEHAWELSLESVKQAWGIE